MIQYGQMCGEGSGKTKRFAKRKVTMYKGQLMVLKNRKYLERCVILTVL